MKESVEVWLFEMLTRWKFRKKKRCFKKLIEVKSWL